MLQLEMTARVRKTIGKGAARSLRRAGSTPAIVYGPKGDPIMLECNTRELTRGLLSVHRKNAFINLEIEADGKKSVRHVITKEIQTDPVQDTVLHADFYEVSLDQPMVFQVPVSFVGKAKGVDMGGDMTILMRKVAVKGKMLDIPDSIEFDVSPMGPGTATLAKDLPLPAGVSLAGSPETICVSVSGTAE